MTSELEKQLAESEEVYFVIDYWDGPRGGVAGFRESLKSRTKALIL